MKKAILKGVVLAIVFAAALVLLGRIMNQGNTDMTIEMSEASYPVVSLFTEGYQVNSLHGYAESMETAYLRDTIYPVGSDRKIDVRVDTYGNEIAGIAFEVRSINGERLVESTPVTDYEQGDASIDFGITLKDLIEPETEYMLVFLVTPAERDTIRYYTRIVLNDSLYVREKLDYITDFHQRTFDKTAAKELTKYLESNSEGDNTTFHKVTIHSSFDQITWGSLTVREVSEPTVSIRELTEQMGSFDMEYLATVRNGIQTDYYKIREFYRIRYTPDRMYLLDYEREMDRIFDENADVYANDKIELGIAGDEIRLVESDGGNVFAFTTYDRLYSYNVTDNKLIRLFGFYGDMEELTDERNGYDRHKIQILSVDETGNVMFTVYGYMNRGRHEGEVGVAVCQYNSMTNTVEEMAYIPYHKSYELLAMDMERLSYVNKADIYYFMIDGSVYAVNLASKSYQVIVDSLRPDSCYVCDSNKMLVWKEGDDPYACSSLVLMNLSTQQRTTVSAGAGEYISVLGFMGEDLIYGLARKRDVTVNEAGAAVFPMYRVLIQSEEGDILKTYEKENVYVTEGVIADNQITLRRVTRDEETGAFTAAADDQIMSNEEVQAGSNRLDYAVTENYETICQIQVKDEIDGKSLKHLSPKEVLFEGNRTVTVQEADEEQARYYVYAKNGIEGIFVNPGQAVELAYETAGAVVDDDGHYIWRRTIRSVRNQIMAITEEEATEDGSPLAVCLDTILKFEGVSRNTQRRLENGESAFSILEAELSEYVILDLSGCPLDAVLYYVNMDIPVLATLQDSGAVLVIGFNELNVVLMDPETGTIYKKGMNDSAQWFAENGNCFIAYAKKAQD